MNFKKACVLVLVLNVGQFNGQTTLNIREQDKMAIIDANYSYVDTFINDCLHKIDLCESGQIVVFNVSVSYTSSSHNRVVLYTSGGDSPYTPGGVYLHQIAIRGDFYLELGIGYRLNIFTTKVKLINDFKVI